MLFIILFYFISNTQSVSFEGVTISTFSPDPITIFFSNSKNPHFDYDGTNGFNCVFPNVLQDPSSLPNRNFSIQNNRSISHFPPYFYVSKIEASSSNTLTSPKIKDFAPALVHPSEKPLNFILEYNCLSDQGWSLINLQILIDEEPLNFSFIKLCEEKNLIYYVFDDGLLVLAGFVTLLLGYIARKPKFHTFYKEFRGVNVNLNFILSYVVLASLSFVGLYYLLDIFRIFFIILMATIATVAFGVIFNEILSLALVKYKVSRILIQIPRVGSLSLFFIVGMVVMLPLAIYWGIS